MQQHRRHQIQRPRLYSSLPIVARAISRSKEMQVTGIQEVVVVSFFRIDLWASEMTFKLGMAEMPW